MQKLSPAGHKQTTGSKEATALTNSTHANSAHADSGHADSGHTEMAMQTPYHADQCVQQMLCRLTGTYEPHGPKVIVTSAPVAPGYIAKGEKPH